MEYIIKYIYEHYKDLGRMHTNYDKGAGGGAKIPIKLFIKTLIRDSEFNCTFISAYSLNYQSGRQ